VVFSQHPAGAHPPGAHPQGGRSGGSGLLDGGAADLEFTALDPCRFVRERCQDMRGTAWLFGGRALIRSFMEADLIDNYLIYVMPVLLGQGVPLFSPPGPRFPLKLIRIAKTDEIVKIFYTRDR
jgi:hypothetical protein